MFKRNSSFSCILKEKRIKKGLGLREFCRINGLDPGNWIKDEKGILKPANDKKTLESIAKSLGIKKNSDEWYDLFDHTALLRGEIPHDLIEDKEVLKILPLFFNRIREEKPSNKNLKNIYELFVKEIEHVPIKTKFEKRWYPNLKWR